MPEHRRYVEPYMGAASVLMRKPRVHSEILNDLDGEITGLFEMIRERGDELSKALFLTPFARSEFEEAWQPTQCAFERARRCVVRSFMGFGSAAATEARENGRIMTGFRVISDRSGATPAHDWMNYPEAMMAMVERLRGVVIENRPALEVIRRYDAESTLFYIDPPYLMETRADKQADYRHEMTDVEHEELAEQLHLCRGRVLLSGYPSGLYERLFKDWIREEVAALADGSRSRTEVLWMNFEPQRTAQRELF